MQMKQQKQSQSTCTQIAIYSEQAQRKRSEVSGLFTLKTKIKQYNLYQIPQKIMGCCLMFNDTFVVIGIRSHRVQFVGHYSSEGKLLNSIQFPDGNLFTYCVPDDRHIVWPDQDGQALYQWNVSTYDLLKIQINYEVDKADSHEVFFFQQSKILAVGEWGRHDSNFIQFTFFSYPLTKQSKPLLIWQDNTSWTYQYMVKKANEKNKFLWFKGPYKQNFQFKTFSIIKHQDGKYEPKLQQFSIKNPFCSKDGICEISAGFMWEMRPDIYGVVSITDRPLIKNKYPSCIFIFDTKQHIFREAKFALQGKLRYQNIHWQSFGDFFMARGFNWEKGVSQQVDTYYFSNQLEQTVGKGRWVCSNLHKYCVPGSQKNTIMDCQYINLDPNFLKITQITIQISDVAIVHMIQQLMPNVDEDLLREILHLLKG